MNIISKLIPEYNESQDYQFSEQNKTKNKTNYFVELSIWLLMLLLKLETLKTND